jgi:hypothetical protein
MSLGCFGFLQQSSDVQRQFQERFDEERRQHAEAQAQWKIEEARLKAEMESLRMSRPQADIAGAEKVNMEDQIERLKEQCRQHAEAQAQWKTEEARLRADMESLRMIRPRTDLAGLEKVQLEAQIGYVSEVQVAKKSLPTSGENTNSDLLGKLRGQIQQLL